MNTIATPVTQRDVGGLAVAASPPGTSRIAAYLDLAKPRIALMVLLSAAAGFALASQGDWQPLVLLHACVGIFLAVVSSSALNQWIERETDGRMLRTKFRPLPSGRLTGEEVLAFGLACGAASIAYLLLTVNVATALLTLATIVLYAGCYTPLKRHTALCTVVGAVPGALPPVLGWAAAGGDLWSPAWSLFAIIFIWQFPHFLAIAWMYREQYEFAGLRMIPGRGRPGIISSVSLGYALVLIPVSLLPAQLGLAGDPYAIVALALGLFYAWGAWRFWQAETRTRARQLLWISLAYLPGVLLALWVDHFRLLN